MWPLFVGNKIYMNLHTHISSHVQYSSKCRTTMPKTWGCSDVARAETAGNKRCYAARLTRKKEKKKDECPCTCLQTSKIALRYQSRCLATSRGKLPFVLPFARDVGAARARAQKRMKGAVRVYAGLTAFLSRSILSRLSRTLAA